MQRKIVIYLVLAVPLIGCGRERLSPEDLPRRKAEVSSQLETSPPIAATSPPGSAAAETFDAAMRGDLQSVTKAVDNGWDVNSADEAGRTALQLAAFDGHTEVVQYLLDRGATVNHRDSAGRTALMYASTADNGPTVAALLKAGAEVNLLDAEEHFSALMFAAAEGQVEIVQQLLSAGADRSLKDIDGDSAVDFARKNQREKVVELLQPASP